MLTLLLFPPVGTVLDRAIDLAERPGAPVHAAVLCGDYYVEAVAPLVRMMPAERLGATVRRVPVTATEQQETAVIAYLRARVGTQHYSVQVLALDAIGALSGRWLAAPTVGVDCSGLVAEAFVAADIFTTLPRDPGLVMPSDLLAWSEAGQPHDLGALLRKGETS